MNVRALLLVGVLASGLTLTFAPRVAADSADQHHWRHDNGDRDYIRPGRWNDPQHSTLVDRINYNRAKIAEIGPTGRNHRALQWYRDDLRDAERDMRNYRRDHDDDDSSDGYYDARSNPSGDATFAFDWSSLLGKLLNPMR